jgi:SPP1 gp7 family putative phage head morphogenesis protein
MTVNTDVYDRTIAHLADVRLYEAENQKLIGRSIRRHQERLTKIIRSGDQSKIKGEVTRVSIELKDIAKNAIDDYTSAAILFEVNNLEKAIGSVYKIKKPSIQSVSNSVINRRGPFRDIEKHFEQIGTGLLARINQKYNNAKGKDISQKELIQDILRTTNLTEAQAKSVVRTALTNVDSAATYVTMQENKEVLKGYRFTAVLDSRTSAICSSKDGEIYDIDDTRFVPPLHWNCRSSLVPVLKSKDELQEMTSDRLTKSKLENVSGKELEGTTPKVESYGQWLKRQTMDIKFKHLGSEEKVSLFEKGNLEVRNFFTDLGKAIDITVLRKLDNARINLFSNRSTLDSDAITVDATRPRDILKNPFVQAQLRRLYIEDSNSNNQAMSVTDFRGTSLAGKRDTRRRASNDFDERNQQFNPVTGEVRSNLLYDPDFNVYQERIDFMQRSKLLTAEQKNFIQSFVETLDDQVSVNNQSVIIENLRLVFERFNRDKVPWTNFVNVLRSEANFSVVNVSRILDRRSREAAEMFNRYLGGDKASVQIFGKQVTFEDLASGLLARQREIDKWRSTTGKQVALKLYTKGRAPLRSYFDDPDKSKLPVTVKEIKKLVGKKLDKIPETIKDSIPGYRFYEKMFDRTQESSWNRLQRNLRENYRNIIDAEWSFLKSKEEYLLDAISNKSLNKKLDVVSKIVETIADGKSTDYDTLAINIGKTLKENWQPLWPWHTPTLQEYHKAGSDILQSLRTSGTIRVTLRGKVRRSVIDLDTGRPSGPWKDTLSREVVIIDKDMLRLQELQRQNVIAQRINIINNRDRVYVLPGKKTYVDARGKDTGIPVVTRRAFGNYDELQIDRDFANMLNHAMSVQYEVDQTFVSFMDDVVRFRDPRGNVKFYDDINHFRSLIIKRGDEGFGLMQTAKFHAQRDKPFTTLAQIDSRGRVYFQGYLSPTGGEVARPFLNSARAQAMTPTALRELFIQTGALIGPATEALTQAGRLEIFRRSEKDILSLGRILMSKTQRDRRLREFLEHPLIRTIEGEEVPKMARLALEYARLHDHVSGDFTNLTKLSTYRTKLMIENDASASGAQIIGLSTGDRNISVNSNVLATTKKNRLYDLVAMDTVSDPEFQKIAALRDAGITWEDLSKAAKAQIMVAFYGAGAATQTANIEAKFSKILKAKGFLVITREEARGVYKIIDRAIKDAEFANADAVIVGLKNLKKEINELLEKQSPVGNKIIMAARELHPDVEDFVLKITNTKSGLITPNDFKAVSNIMARNLSDRAPITGKFIQFWKDAGESFVKETQKVDIPWVTFDGKKLYQRYRPKVQERIEFFDPVTRRMVRNIYEDSATDNIMRGKSAIGDARIGLGVNGNHANDASIVRQFLLWGRKNNVDTATIHDAFFTNIADAQRAKDAIRSLYADAVESNTILNTLKAMRADGLSQATYNRLVAKAKAEGLIDPPNKITKKDILAPIPKGFDFYGIGP